MQYDDYGIPILRNLEIEFLAEEFLQAYWPKLLERPFKLPILSLLFEYLPEQYHVNVQLTHFEQIDHEIVLGKTLFEENTILLEHTYVDDMCKFQLKTLPLFHLKSLPPF